MASGLENLKIYRLAENLEKIVYKITAKFPPDEKYRRVDQMRRAAASTCDNIAEGYGKYSFGSKINSFYTARGEAEEIRRQIERCKELFINQELSGRLIKEYTNLIKGINGYIKFLRKQKDLKLSNKLTK